ncbi:RapZ C-terminal domain-containing protein [Kitasatospora sp. HPMI-4]|uniref:RapZ C-terminal domain-containing protein n=1 Tax=Kitasatospora sp. HPMI-4 TaxID=3448443 RepID=UPI003F1C54F0
MASETSATTTESCDRRLLRLERIESPLIAQLAAAIGHLRTAGEHADPAASLAHYPGRTVRDLTGWVGGNVQMVAELLVPLIAPHTRVEITSYGVLHQDPPAGDALTLDLTTALRNPPEDPAVREVMIASTGLDQVVYDYVLATPGAVEIAERTALRVLAQAAALPGQPVALHVYCRGGRHRSVTLARRVGELCEALGAAVSVTHRHAHLPVQESAR